MNLKGNLGKVFFIEFINLLILDVNFSASTKLNLHGLNEKQRSIATQHSKSSYDGINNCFIYYLDHIEEIRSKASNNNIKPIGNTDPDDVINDEIDN